ncbi:MAG: MurR/RpiR family transcriptional regulator [Bacillota bacterium]|nr:MurR/RpiR family transcriptional regulator [Bacillota bacterium]
MLLREKMETGQFSSSEKSVVDYIKKKGTHIQNMTVKEIAEATYTVPSTLIRIAKKLNYNGWNDLKEDFVRECEYLESHFLNIDANLPFKNNDTIMSIAGKIATLKKESIEDTLSLIKHDDLQKAIQIIRKSSCIHLFAVSNNLLITQEFKHNMSRIRKDVRIHGLQNEIIFDATLASPDSCALIVSYSGETYVLDRIAQAGTTSRKSTS